MKNISIITNFGCPCKCKYCIMQGHYLEGVQNEWNYSKLDDFLYENSGSRLSISGGGDPLNNYFEHLKFWIFIIKTTKKYDIKLSIHTRIILPKNRFWRNSVDMAVISVDKLTDTLKADLLYLKQLTKVRVTHVLIEDDISELIDFCTKNDIQLTIKECHEVNGIKNDNYNIIKNQYPNVFFLDDDDYNVYYMPNNTITTNFLRSDTMSINNK